MLKTSVVIPNWEGKHLLEKNLPSVLAIGANEVIVIENGSTDGSLEYLQEKFPQVKLIINPTNLGFARAVNQGFKSAKGDIVILLNTDVVPEKALLKHVLPHFKGGEVFAVSFNEKEWSWARGYFNKGLIEHSPGEKSNETHISFWASGGSGAFDRQKWIELNGLSLIYEPFYWEDTDISYRAQKRGWQVFWEPKAEVEHKHEATVKKHSLGQKKDLISQRNQILFFWCNVSSLSLWIQHLLWIPIRVLMYGYFIPLFWAILRLPQVLSARAQKKGEKITDEEILNKFKS